MSKGARKESHDVLLEFWDPLHISGMVELETSNLACKLTTEGTNDNNENFKGGQEGVT